MIVFLGVSKFEILWLNYLEQLRDLENEGRAHICECGCARPQFSRLCDLTMRYMIFEFTVPESIKIIKFQQF